MSALSTSAKMEIVGCVGSVLAFAILFVGLGAIGGGHGSPVIWYVGIVAALASGFLLLVATIRSSVKKTERKSFVPGIVAVVITGIVWLEFFPIADWLGQQFYG